MPQPYSSFARAPRHHGFRCCLGLQWNFMHTLAKPPWVTSSSASSNFLGDSVLAFPHRPVPGGIFGAKDCAI